MTRPRVFLTSAGPTATTPIGAKMSVGIVKWMPVLAMGSLCLCTATHILGMGHGFEMCRSHAYRHTAKMIGHKIIGHQTDEQFIGDAMARTRCVPSQSCP